MKTLEPMPKISFGNKKLPKDTMIFNLPAVKTCPGKTDFCAKKCYALKAEKLYPQVYPARKHNLKLTLDDSFCSKMLTLINGIKHKINRVRIHESGDFYSQEYLNKWFLVASEFPSIAFYAYTKSFHLDFRKKPSNFRLIASFDQSTSETAKALYQWKKESFDNVFEIVGKNEAADCIQDCSECSACWSQKNLHIKVNVH